MHDFFFFGCQSRIHITDEGIGGILHIARVTQGEPLIVRHTGRFDADGGAILEEVKPDEGSA